MTRWQPPHPLDELEHADRLAKSKAGVKSRKRKMGYRKFDGSVVPPRWE